MPDDRGGEDVAPAGVLAQNSQAVERAGQDHDAERSDRRGAGERRCRRWQSETAERVAERQGGAEEKTPEGAAGRHPRCRRRRRRQRRRLGAGEPDQQQQKACRRSRHDGVHRAALRQKGANCEQRRGHEKPECLARERRQADRRAGDQAVGGNRQEGAAEQGKEPQQHQDEEHAVLHHALYRKSPSDRR
jgi:hypothetical protein